MGEAAIMERDERCRPNAASDSLTYAAGRVHRRGARAWTNIASEYERGRAFSSVSTVSVRERCAGLLTSGQARTIAGKRDMRRRLGRIIARAIVG
jgi:hypothetical protein